MAQKRRIGTKKTQEIKNEKQISFSFLISYIHIHIHRDKIHIIIKKRMCNYFS